MPWAALRARVTDPRHAIERLGLTEGATRSGTGYLVRCPWHAERTPSCSVTSGPDGTLRARCFSCGATGDLWGLVAARLGVPPASRELLEAGLDLFDATDLATDSPRPRRDRAALPPRPAPESSLAPERVYPSPEAIARFWGSLEPVTGHPDCSLMLDERGIDPAEVERRDLARALPEYSDILPAARFRGRTWDETTHRLVVPVFDAEGKMRSVRGWACLAGVEGAPKRLPLAGYLSAGLLLANALFAGAMASGKVQGQYLITEGEPDYLTWASRWDGPVCGIGSGWWTQAHADRIPWGAEVIIATHRDRAGDKYAQEVASTLRGKVTIRRR